MKPIVSVKPSLACDSERFIKTDENQVKEYFVVYSRLTIKSNKMPWEAFQTRLDGAGLGKRIAQEQALMLFEQNLKCLVIFQVYYLLNLKHSTF